MAIEFEFNVIRPNLEGGESEIEAYVECVVSTSLEDEGLLYFVDDVKAVDYDGNDIEFTRTELPEVYAEAIKIFRGQY